MRKLLTIQKRENLNEVFALNDKGPGGAHHVYAVTARPEDDLSENLAVIRFQKGPRKNFSSIQGVLDTDLLEIVRDRLTCFQAGEFACQENEEALIHINLCLEAMNRRVENRIARQVLGTYEK